MSFYVKENGELKILAGPGFSKLSQMESDVEHRTVSDEQISKWDKGGGISFETGNELVLDNDVLRYKANYGTTSEFNIFKERSDVPVGATYHVTDDYVEGSGSTEIYDDTERVIGTWFGKPLYRKTIQFTTSDSARNFKNIANITGFEIHNLYGFVDAIPINYFYFDANNLLNSGTGVLVNSAKTSLLSISYGTQYLNKNGNVTIEYTKVGD